MGVVNSLPSDSCGSESPEATPERDLERVLAQVTFLLGNREALSRLCTQLVDEAATEHGQGLSRRELRTLTQRVIDGNQFRDPAALKELLDMLAPLSDSGGCEGGVADSGDGGPRLGFNGFVCYARCVLRVLDAALRSDLASAGQPVPEPQDPVREVEPESAQSQLAHTCANSAAPEDKDHQAYSSPNSSKQYMDVVPADHSAQMAIDSPQIAIIVTAEDLRKRAEEAAQVAMHTAHKKLAGQPSSSADRSSEVADIHPLACVAFEGNTPPIHTQRVPVQERCAAPPPHAGKPWTWRLHGNSVGPSKSFGITSSIYSRSCKSGDRRSTGWSLAVPVLFDDASRPHRGASVAMPQFKGASITAPAHNFASSPDLGPPMCLSSARDREWSSLTPRRDCTGLSRSSAFTIPPHTGSVTPPARGSATAPVPTAWPVHRSVTRDQRSLSPPVLGWVAGSAAVHGPSAGTQTHARAASVFADHSSPERYVCSATPYGAKAALHGSYKQQAISPRAADLQPKSCVSYMGTGITTMHICKPSLSRTISRAGPDMKRSSSMTLPLAALYSNPVPPPRMTIATPPQPRQSPRQHDGG